mmetsp:Transcript_113103/g.365348  ORF Transcript_113103/g.365348 Transcript_113103/m.365348 type:complete len:211 (-) Transcript_113103:563-1195(-)
MLLVHDESVKPPGASSTPVHAGEVQRQRVQDVDVVEAQHREKLLRPRRPKVPVVRGREVEVHDLHAQRGPRQGRLHLQPRGRVRPVGDLVARHGEEEVVGRNSEAREPPGCHVPEALPRHFTRILGSCGVVLRLVGAVLRLVAGILHWPAHVLGDLLQPEDVRPQPLLWPGHIPNFEAHYGRRPGLCPLTSLCEVFPAAGLIDGLGELVG